MLIAIIGDVHAQLPRAVHVLDQVEQQAGDPIAQIFSVGDLGLFLDPEDWDCLTGPKKYRQPETTPAILDAWRQWRWPLAMIGGNHEPFNRLRAFDPDWFGPKLTYTNGGILEHAVPGLTVYGLTGIYHPEHLEFLTPEEQRQKSVPHVHSWAEMAELIATGQMSPKRLTYYKEAELAALKALPPTPHLLLTHDWPRLPDGASQIHSRRPEAELVEKLRPILACCGHHHSPGNFDLGKTKVLGLDIIAHPNTPRYAASPQWYRLLRWDGGVLNSV